jgi:hypothetical protein
MRNISSGAGSHQQLQSSDIRPLSGCFLRNRRYRSVDFYRSDRNVSERVQRRSLVDVSPAAKLGGRDNGAGTGRGEKRRLVTLRQLLLVVCHSDYRRVRRPSAGTKTIEDRCDRNRIPGAFADRHHHCTCRARRNGGPGSTRGYWLNSAFCKCRALVLPPPAATTCVRRPSSRRMELKLSFRCAPWVRIYRWPWVRFGLGTRRRTGQERATTREIPSCGGGRIQNTGPIMRS